MKISDIIDELKKIKSEYGDLSVCMSIDAEGNGFHMLSPENWYSIGRFRDYEQFDQYDATEEFGVPSDLCIWP
jgi:hypothetical protein